MDYFDKHTIVIFEKGGERERIESVCVYERGREREKERERDRGEL